MPIIPFQKLFINSPKVITLLAMNHTSSKKITIRQATARSPL